jgi:hypothetical protein
MAVVDFNDIPILAEKEEEEEDEEEKKEPPTSSNAAIHARFIDMESGEYYYHCFESEDTTWDEPTEWREPTSEELAGRDSRGDAITDCGTGSGENDGHTASAHRAGEAVPSECPLTVSTPANWRQYFDATSGKCYYFDSSTGATVCDS